MVRVNFNDRQVGFLIGTDYLRIVGDARGIVFQLHPNAVRLLHHVTVGDDVALGINDDAGTQGALPEVGTAECIRALSSTLPTLSARPAEEAVKKVLKRILIVIIAPAPAAARRPNAPVRILDSGFSIDVDHTGLKLLGDGSKSVRHLARRRYLQRGRIGGGILALLPANAVGHHGADQNPDGQGYENSQSVGWAARRQPCPKRAGIHTFPPDMVRKTRLYLPLLRAEKPLQLRKVELTTL